MIKKDKKSLQLSFLLCKKSDNFGVFLKKNVKVSLAIIGFLVLSFSTKDCFCAEFSFNELMKYNNDYISNIYTCGEWEFGDKKGYYRIIYVNFLYGCSWLYIQWMKDFCCDGTTKSFFTLPVYTNDHHENTFDIPQCISTQDGIKVMYSAENGHDQKLYNVSINVFQDIGKYKIITNIP